MRGHAYRYISSSYIDASWHHFVNFFLCFFLISWQASTWTNAVHCDSWRKTPWSVCSHHEIYMQERRYCCLKIYKSRCRYSGWCNNSRFYSWANSLTKIALLQKWFYPISEISPELVFADYTLFILERLIVELRRKVFYLLRFEAENVLQMFLN